MIFNSYQFMISNGSSLKYDANEHQRLVVYNDVRYVFN
ncbi:unnamed protein product, partial [Rotaria magnacalcarata]